MGTHLEDVLFRAVDRTRVDRLQATFIPSPPHATAYPGNHLFINCHYVSSVLESGIGNCLEVARAEVVMILRCLATMEALRHAVSVCVTILVPSASGEQAHSLRRLYRYSVLSSAISREPGTIDINSILSNGFCLQDSEFEEIRDLMANEPPRETQLSSALWNL